MLWPRVGRADRRVARGARAPRPAAARRRSSRCRCCSSPAWRADSTRRSRWSPTRTCARSAQTRAGTRGSRGERRASFRRTKSRNARTSRVRNDGTIESWSGSCPNCSMRYEHSDLPRPTSTAPRGHAAPAACLRACRCSAWPPSWPVRRAIAGTGPLEDEVREITLPLRHEDIIRQQAADKDLDAGADRRRHLPGVEVPRPDLARRRARPDADHCRRPPTTSPSKSGGTEFEQGDLATPQINIAYGSWYLRYLIDHTTERTLALAAYNAGETNVDEWVSAPAASSFRPGRHPVPGDARLRGRRDGPPRRVPQALRRRAGVLIRSYASG